MSPEKQHLVCEDLFFCTLTLAGSAETHLTLNPQHAGKSECAVKHFDWLKKTRKGFYIPIVSKLRRGQPFLLHCVHVSLNAAASHMLNTQSHLEITFKVSGRKDHWSLIAGAPFRWVSIYLYITSMVVIATIR